MTEMTWAMPVVLDLFFAGLASGAFCLAVLACRREGSGFAGVARAAALLAPASVGFGLSMLILDLRYKTRFWYTMTVWNGDSPMSLGVWLLTLFSSIAALYAMFWIPADIRLKIPVIGGWSIWSRQRVRDVLGTAGVPVALLVSIYTGVLLSATSVPLWRNPVLPALFCFSGLATGFAAGLLSALVFSPGMRQAISDGPVRWIRGAYRVLLPAYLLAAVAFVAWLFVPGMGREPLICLISGSSGLIWWLGAVCMGIVFPMVLSFARTETFFSRPYAILGSLLAGGFLMRLLLVYMGQM
ncbi:MAG TPA: NrfD/PsrC family molybdoenzyme membrane anchor subunit [Geobacteraceae bacterium]|nr:NrfD/PsrC family molybdoenzyme membrane anchor subunit [Geobacteraceae bacterium]